MTQTQVVETKQEHAVCSVCDRKYTLSQFYRPITCSRPECLKKHLHPYLDEYKTGKGGSILH